MFARLKSFLFENRTTKQTVAKNTFWLTVSNFGGRLLKSVVVIYAARVLGTAGNGVASYALTIAGFLTLFIDPGINSLLMRETSKRNPEEQTTFFAVSFALKVAFILMGVLVVLFIVPLFTVLPGAAALLPIAALIIFFDALREFLSSFMRAREKMEWETAVFLLTNLLIVISGFVLLKISPVPASFIWAYAIGTSIGTIVAAYILRDYLKKVFSSFSRALIKPIISSAWPFAITGALGVLLTNADILIISWLRTASELGIYAAAVRIIQVLYLVPMIFQFSTLPLLSRLAENDNERFRAGLERTIGFVFLASVPMAIGGLIIGTQFMSLLFGSAYAGGGLSFKILMIALLFDYPATIIGAAVFAYNHQRSLITAAAIGGIANVGLDLIFIPLWGIAGSATATLLAQTFSNWYLWHKMKEINYFEILPRLKTIIVSGLAMGGVTIGLYVLNVNVIFNILISGATYFIMLRLLREPLLIEVKRLLFS